MPLYIWMPPVCLDTPFMFGYYQMYGGIQRYEGHPNIWEVSRHTGASKHMGHLNVWGAYGHPLSLTKHSFSVLCMYRGYTNVWGHMDTPSV